MEHFEEEANNNAAIVRFVVKDCKDADRISVVCFEATSDAQLNVLMAEDAPHKDLLNDCVEQAVDALKATKTQKSGDWLKRLAADVCARIAERGEITERLPDADIEVKFEIDMRSGVVVGRPSVLHPYASLDFDIAKNVGVAVSRAFDAPAEALSKTLRQKISIGEYIEAAKTVIEPGNAALAIISRNDALLRTMCEIKRSTLPTELRFELQRVLVTFAGNQSQEHLVSTDAEDLLKNDAKLNDAARYALRNFIGVAAAKLGQSEYARSIWQGLLQVSDQIEAGQRGWIWRNLSRVIEKDDPTALEAAQNSADAFLEAGDKREAALSIKQISKLLEKIEPNKAIQQFDRMFAVMSKNGVMDDEICANIFHAKAAKLLEFGNPCEALKAAKEAVKLRRGLLGSEEALISSVHLSAICAQNDGSEDEYRKLDAEAKSLEGKLTSPHFDIARRAKMLLEDYDEAEAGRLLSDAEKGGDLELFAGVSVVAAIKAPGLSPSERVGKLEAILRHLDRHNARAGTKHPARLAIAQIFRDQGEWRRAAKWYRTILTDKPLDSASRHLFVDTLWRAKDWAGAADFLKQQLQALGDQPGILFAYGKSMLELGEASEAVKAFSKALPLAVGDEVLIENILALRETALARGGTILPDTTPKPPSVHVSLEYVRTMLSEFREYVSGTVRMAFWTRPDIKQDYRWRPSPEGQGQLLLRTFAKGKFFALVDDFEELDTGAGRLDLLLKFSGGLSIIIELKMCGFGYSSNYAASGELQIKHYMINRNVHVGFLVVFDARLRKNGQQLLENRHTQEDTIEEILIDVRPRVV